MTDSIVNLIQTLKSRDAIVNAPKGLIEIRRLETFLTRKLDSDFHEFYLYCDGFVGDDSFMSLWTIEEIISNKRSDQLNKKFTTIGDFLMESDYIIANLNDNESPIKLQYEDRILSSNIREFLKGVMLGLFD